MSKVIDKSITGVTTKMHIDPVTKDFTISTHQDVSDVIQNNKQLESNYSKYGKSRDMKLVASIPMNVIAVWKQQHGVDFFNPAHKDGIKKLLNSPEYAFLRTSPGKI